MKAVLCVAPANYFPIGLIAHKPRTGVDFDQFRVPRLAITSEMGDVPIGRTLSFINRKSPWDAGFFYRKSAAAWANGRSDLASWCWAAGTMPVVVGLLLSMIRDFLADRVGVDSVAFVSMSGALVLGQNLAGIVIAIMYAGGNVLEDFAVGRAERDLKSLIDRAPSTQHIVRSSIWRDYCIGSPMASLLRILTII